MTKGTPGNPWDKAPRTAAWRRHLLLVPVLAGLGEGCGRYETTGTDLASDTGSTPPGTWTFPVETGETGDTGADPTP